MKTWPLILSLAILGAFMPCGAAGQGAQNRLDFFGDTVVLPAVHTPQPFNAPLSPSALSNYLNALDTATLQPYVNALLFYKQVHHPDDWLYYQLVRQVAQVVSPKGVDYYRYTFYKWWFLHRTGYDARLTIADSYLLFYVQSDEEVYNIPYRTENGKQYVCLNYHDYGSIDFAKHRFVDATPAVFTGSHPFSYRVQTLPAFKATDYTEKEVRFASGINHYSFRIKINPRVKSLFTNYPAVNYDLQFNMPLSKATYESLIPSLKKELKGWKQKDGVEFLMRFTRYAFLFKPDHEVFGAEKRLTPEQTLLYEYSDCEDRAALFFLLVKEIYNLPMLVLTYPAHVSVAVQFEKGYGTTILYKGSEYTVCEPSPQKIDLRVGQLLPELRRQSYQVAFAYKPD